MDSVSVPYEEINVGQIIYVDETHNAVSFDTKANLKENEGIWVSVNDVQNNEMETAGHSSNSNKTIKLEEESIIPDLDENVKEMDQNSTNTQSSPQVSEFTDEVTQIYLDEKECHILQTCGYVILQRDFKRYLLDSEGLKELVSEWGDEIPTILNEFTHNEVCGEGLISNIQNCNLCIDDVCIHNKNSDLKLDESLKNDYAQNTEKSIDYDSENASTSIDAQSITSTDPDKQLNIDSLNVDPSTIIISPNSINHNIDVKIIGISKSMLKNKDSKILVGKTTTGKRVYGRILNVKPAPETEKNDKYIEIKSSVNKLSNSSTIKVEKKCLQTNDSWNNEGFLSFNKLVKEAVASEPDVHDIKRKNSDEVECENISKRQKPNESDVECNKHLTKQCENDENPEAKSSKIYIGKTDTGKNVFGRIVDIKSTSGKTITDTQLEKLSHKVKEGLMHIPLLEISSEDPSKLISQDNSKSDSQDKIAIPQYSEVSQHDHNNITDILKNSYDSSFGDGLNSVSEDLQKELTSVKELLGSLVLLSSLNHLIVGRNLMVHKELKLQGEGCEDSIVKKYLFTGRMVGSDEVGWEFLHLPELGQQTTGTTDKKILNRNGDYLTIKILIEGSSNTVVLFEENPDVYQSNNISEKSFDELIKLSHVRRIDGRKCYECAHCKKHFYGIAHFKRHVRIHIGGSAKPAHICYICNCVFSHMSTLTKHFVQVHRDVATFSVIKKNT